MLPSLDPDQTSSRMPTDTLPEELPQNKHRALIVDDERLARVELRRMLKAHPTLEIVGEAEDADDAHEQISRLQPDVVFLDVQMPEKTGLELAAELITPPAIIFTTAHDSFALQAFDTNALDYLVKPIDPVRLARAISKLARFQPHKTRFTEPREPNSDNTLLATAILPVSNDDEEQEFQVQTTPEIAPHERLQEESRLVIKEGERYWFVTVGDIRFLESEGNYTRVFFGKNKPLMPRSLAHLEERLDPHLFFRASRKHIVNIRAIQGVEAWHHGGLMLQMSCGTHIEMSRRQALRFKEIMMI